MSAYGGVETRADDRSIFDQHGANGHLARGIRVARLFQCRQHEGLVVGHDLVVSSVDPAPPEGRLFPLDHQWRM